MTYRLPNFNLSCKIYAVDGDPDHPRVVTDCNLAAGIRSRVLQGNTDVLDAPVAVMQLLLPAGTDVRDEDGASASPDIVEVPLGSGRTYLVVYVDDARKGFPTEYRWALLAKRAPWPEPIP